MKRKHLNKLAFAFLFLVSSFVGRAQDPNVTAPGGGGSISFPAPGIDRSLIPQTPDAAAFTKYGDIPVNLSRGVPNINLPLFNTRLGKLPVDITLSYAYTGYKPNEVPSWVGLGWTLNVGGMITRTVRGMIDEDNTNRVPYGMLDNIPDPAWFQSNQLFLNEVGTNRRDAEPDIYHYSFPSHSGRFLLKNGRAITFPFDNIKISKTSAGFTVVTEEGTIYSFNSTETVWTKLQQGSNTPQTYISGWHLTSVVSADRADVIRFGYKAVSYLDYSTANSQQVTYSDNYANNPYNYVSPFADLKTSNGPTRINGLQLISLQSPALTIAFELDDASVRQDIEAGGSYYALKDFVVYNSADSVVKKVNFSYDYFTGNAGRLKLKQVTETGPGESQSGLNYRFAYENESNVFPDPYTNGLDIYGYYNGKDGNGNLAFSTPTGYLPPQGMTGPSGNDRNPNITYCRYGALNKIIYPTGGYTTLSYELNPGPGLRIGSYTSVDPVANKSTTKTFAYVNDDGRSSIQFLGGSQVYQPSMYYDVQACAGEGVVMTPEDHQSVANLNVVAGFDYLRLEDQPFYYATVSELDGTVAEAHKTTSRFNAYGGGLTDVYQTESTQYKSSGVSFVPLQSNTLNYTLPEQLADTSQSGVASKVDIVACSLSPFLPTNTDPNLRSQQYRGESYTLYSYLRTLSGQTITGYSNNGVNQSVQHLYFYDNPLHRLVTREVLINSSGDWLVTQYTYPFDYPSPCDPAAADRQYKTDLQNLYNTYQGCTGQRQNCTGGASSCYNGYPCEMNACQGYQTVLQNWNVNRANYDACLQHAINNETDPSKQAIRIMQRDHILNTVVEKTVYKRKADGSPAILVGAQKNDFVLSGGAVVPKVIWAAEAPPNTTLDQFLNNKAAYYVRRVSMIYDAKPRLVQQNKEKDVTVAYLWGYQHQYIVAEVQGAGYGDVSGLVKQSVLDNPNSTGQQIKAELNNLRAGLANTKAVVTTYTYKPLVGMTSQTDPNGRTTYYEYDAFGRLSLVRDHDNKILKKICYNYQGQPEDCSCPTTTAVWQLIASECELNRRAQYNGYKTVVEKDVNPCSPTYEQLRSTRVYDPATCPPPPCDANSCLGPANKCVNGVCEQGCKLYLSSVKISRTTWQCTYVYRFSDGSQSAQYTEYKSSRCPVNTILCD